jgi:xanthine dehydrogenase accessory factor
MFDEFLRKAEELRNADERFAVAVVVRSEPPVSGKPGYKAIIREDGTIWGWIGGGCTQPLVIREALAALKDGKPRLVRITPEASTHEHGVTEYTMTCHSGGALDVYVEPVLPRPHLVIIGRSLVAQTLARLAAAIDYSVTVVTTGGAGDCFQTADKVVERVENCGTGIGRESFIVVATQGEDDEDALEQAASLDARYTAFVASRTKACKIFDYLAEKGVSRERLGRIKAPAGLDIKASTPEEIAVSILAEMIQTKAGKAAGLSQTADTSAVDGIPSRSVYEAMNPQHAGSVGSQEGAPSESVFQSNAAFQMPSVSQAMNPEHAGSVRSQEGKASRPQFREDGRGRDPICGMEVDMGHARHRSDYGSQTFYFCCARCKEKFDQSPELYAARSDG